MVTPLKVRLVQEVFKVNRLKVDSLGRSSYICTSGKKLDDQDDFGGAGDKSRWTELAGSNLDIIGEKAFSN